MKKILLTIAIVASAFTAKAQVPVLSDNFFDNWSIGIQGGVYEPTVGQNVFKDMRAGVNIELSKQFTPSFGVSGTLFTGLNANNNNDRSTTFLTYNPAPKTAFDFSNVSVNALFNLSNIFAGYNGEPRPFEVVARVGAGIGHMWGHVAANHAQSNSGIANLGLDFNFNTSSALTLTVRPAITYYRVSRGLNVNNSQLSLLAGLTFHFPNTNGTRHFKTYNVSEMEATIARLTGQLAQKPTEIIKEVEVIKEVEKPVIIEKTTTIKEQTQLAPVVIFQQGRSTVDASQKPSVAMIATYMKNHPNSKVTINGYASPEGNPELNQKLSNARAKAVYDMLVNTYKISPNRLSYKGLGVTDELFDENDWNRVATFIEDSK